MKNALTLAKGDLINTTAVALYYSQHAIPQRFNAGVIVASIAVSFLGSYTALFVLGKRTGNSGVRNIALLVLAATVMSYVGIWSMHFIGMHMQLEATPTMKWYIIYNSGFTVFSVLAPTFALIVSFLFVDNATSGFRLWKVILAGTLTGGTVALMHYSASFQCNFLVNFKTPQVVVSILLACILCTVGLTAFFRFRSQWQDSFWKRGLCASVLASGVATMHYIAVSGTSYRIRPEYVAHIEDLSGGEKRNNIMVIVIAVTSFVVVVGSICTALIEIASTRESRKKARKLVVASATFDRAGRLMVQSDGTLPLITIEEKILRRSQVMDALDQRSSIFQWLYAVSWNWGIVVPFLRAISDRVIQMETQDYRVHRRQTLTRSQKARRVLYGRPSFGHALTEQNQMEVHLLDLRDKIINASHRLAEDLEVTLPELGIFFDRILATGTKKSVEAAAAKEAYRTKLHATFPAHNQIPDSNVKSDEENSIAVKTTSLFGEGNDESEGATLFVVREVSSELVVQLSKKGYRFTETRFLSNVLADRHAVIKGEMEATLESLQIYAKRGTRPVVQPDGVYVGLFGVRPNTLHHNGGLDVLVYNFARHQIPAYRLPSVARLDSKMIAFLHLVDQMTMTNVSKVCEQEYRKLADQRIIDYEEDEEESDGKIKTAREAEDVLINFYRALMVALEALQKSITFYPDLITTARISCDILEVPSSLKERLAPAHMILIQAVFPIDPISRQGTSHQLLTTAAVSSSPLKASTGTTSGTPFVFTPYTLFAKSQMMMLQGPTSEAFERQVARDLNSRSDQAQIRGRREKQCREVHDEDGKLSEVISEKSDSKPNTPFEGVEMKQIQPKRTTLLFPLMPSKHFNLTPLPKARSSSITGSHGISVSPSIVTTWKGKCNEKGSTSSSSSSSSSASSPIATFANLASMPKESLGIGRFTAGHGKVEVINDQSRFARSPGEQSIFNLSNGLMEYAKDERDSSKDSSSLPTKASNIETRKIWASSLPRAPIRSSSNSGSVGDGRLRMASTSTMVGSIQTQTATTDQKDISRDRAEDISKSTETPVGVIGELRTPDNWQSRQLEELEKYQPNLLLGIFPSEY